MSNQTYKAREEESYKIARRAMKISIACLALVLIIGMIEIYVMVVQVEAMSGISKEVKALQARMDGLK